MSFIYPSFLFALSAIAIPIIIHLFNFRKFKTVHFSNVQFLKEVKQDTQAKSQLKHLLVLVARILSITFLVLAFAQPFIPNSNQPVVGDKTVSIFIDNSFSMNAINKNGALLSDAKKKALEIVSSYSSTDQFQLLTNDFEERHQRLVDKREFEEMLDAVSISSSVKKLSEITSRQLDMHVQANQTNDIQKNISYIISDFQQSSFNFNNFKNDTNITLNLVHLKTEEKRNVYIDTCWFETPVRQNNTNENLHVIIKNSSSENIENNSIKLFINGVQKTPSSFSVEKNSKTEITIPFLSKDEMLSSSLGIMNCYLDINDHPITFDDRFYFSYRLMKNIQILSINKHSSEVDDEQSENIYLNKLFSQDSIFTYTNSSENNLDYSNLSNSNLIIINELKSILSGLSLALKRFVSTGGSLLILPHPDSDISSYKGFLTSINTNYLIRLDTLKTKVDNININHEIYNGVFDKQSLKVLNLNLPTINKHYAFSKNTHNNEDYLLKLQNGDVFLSRYGVEKGKVYLSSVPLNTSHSNFTKHSIFVPTLYNIGIYSQNTQPLFYTLGNNATIETGNTLKEENVYHIKSLNTNFDIIPEHTVLNSKTEINPPNQLKDAGNFNLFAGKKLINGLAFNYNRVESELSCLSEDKLKDEIENNNYHNINILNTEKESLEEYFTAEKKGQEFWKLCLIIALTFLGLEVLLLRYMKG